jgi:hypothetical protein
MRPPPALSSTGNHNYIGTGVQEGQVHALQARQDLDARTCLAASIAGVFGSQLRILCDEFLNLDFKFGGRVVGGSQNGQQHLQTQTQTKRQRRRQKRE